MKLSKRVDSPLDFTATTETGQICNAIADLSSFRLRHLHQFYPFHLLFFQFIIERTEFDR